MTNRCRWFVRTLSARAEDTLRPREEREFREHFAQCGACRESALARDPSLLFASLGMDGKDEVFWGRFWRDLEPGLDGIDRRRAERPARRFRALTGLLAAASGLCAGLLLALAALWSPGGPGAAGASPAISEGTREYYYEMDGTPVVFIVDQRIDF